MYTTSKPTRGGSPRRSFSSSTRFRRTSGSKPTTSYGRPKRSFGGRGVSPRKRGNKKDFIDESLYVNKATHNEVENYTPKHAFADFAIHPSLAENLTAKGLVTPSPIQDQAIPVALRGGDVIGIASTGTGKTACFLIPIINKLVENRDQLALILAPTRELATQVEQEFKALTRNMQLYSVSCVGGMPLYPQLRELDRGVQVIVGTPGRVKDIIARGKIRLDLVHSVVLDEADRMLDMGFIDDMRSILGMLPTDRQSFFFSATFSPDIKRLCNDFLHDPITVAVKARDTASSVEQDIVRAERHKKIDALHDILLQPEAKKVLIFREMKRSADELGRELRTRGFRVLALHGDLRTRERERAVRAFKTGEVQIVVATDVAARGIDIPDITHVINFDVPSTYDTYIHRIGRTGRGGKGGKALTFI